MKFLTLFVLTVGTYVATADDHGSWGYEGETGPDHWGALKINGNQCGLQKQSPIDIDVQKTRYDARLKPLKLKNYDQNTNNITIANNGHSVQLSSSSWQQTLTGGPLDGTFKMLQMHFHWGRDSYRGSEHTVNGKRYPIELHMVHSQVQEPGKPAQTKLAVLGIFFDITAGESSPGIQKLAANIKDMKTHDAKDLAGGITPSTLLPNTRDFFTYEGSLTTPPCSEIVQWLVLREPLKINEKDLAIFRSNLFENNTPMADNFRPVMPLGAREVTSSFVTASTTSLFSSLPLMIVSALLCNH